MSIAVIAFILVVILLSFGFGGMVIRWQNDLKREQIRANSQGNSLGTSELKGLIQEAMEDTVAPIEERLEMIEAHIRQLPEHADQVGLSGGREERE